MDERGKLQLKNDGPSSCSIVAASDKDITTSLSGLFGRACKYATAVEHGRSSRHLSFWALKMSMPQGFHSLLVLNYRIVIIEVFQLSQRDESASDLGLNAEETLHRMFKLFYREVRCARCEPCRSMDVHAVPAAATSARAWLRDMNEVKIAKFKETPLREQPI